MNTQEKNQRKSLLDFELSFKEGKQRSERKDILLGFFTEFKKKYPQFFENYEMPEPKRPPKLANVDLSRKQMAQVPIDDLRKSVLCGTIFADASLRIQPRYRNARIQNRHSTRQKEWFFWKWMVCLREYNKGISSIVLQEPDGYQKRARRLPGETYLGKLRIASKASPKLTALHSVVCENNKEKIERSWLNHMTDYFLMTVWLDDGTLFNGRQGRICLDSTPREQQEVFVDYLKKAWDIDSYIVQMDERMANGEFRHRIYVSDQENLLKLLRIVAPILPVREMLYKIKFVPFNNTDLLQRWASEVSNLVLPEFRNEIREFYNQKLSNSEEDIVQ